MLQAQHLRDLNARGDAEGVILLFEGGRVQSTEASLGEYVKALVKADRLDNTMLARTLQVGRVSSACCMQLPRLRRVTALWSGHSATGSLWPTRVALPAEAVCGVSSTRDCMAWEPAICLYLVSFLQRGAQPSQAGSSYGPGAYQSFASAPAEAMGAQQGDPRMFAGEMECSCM